MYKNVSYTHAHTHTHTHIYIYIFNLISFILHSVNPYKVCNLSDIELVMI
jgi:hypothetical protein